MCQYVECHLFILILIRSSSYATFWMWVHAYATSPGKIKWSGPHQRRWEENEFNFHSVTCYTNSIVSRIHVNTTKLRNFMCTCTLVATCVILWSLECTTCVNGPWERTFNIGYVGLFYTWTNTTNIWVLGNWPTSVDTWFMWLENLQI